MSSVSMLLILELRLREQRPKPKDNKSGSGIKRKNRKFKNIFKEDSDEDKDQWIQNLAKMAKEKYKVRKFTKESELEYQSVLTENRDQNVKFSNISECKDFDDNENIINYFDKNEDTSEGELSHSTSEDDLNSVSKCHPGHTIPLEEEKSDKIDEEEIASSHEEIAESHIFTSKWSNNYTSDMEEHSGLKRLEQHLGNYNEEMVHPTVEYIDTDKVQHVTEVSIYKDEELEDSWSFPINSANQPILSRMVEESSFQQKQKNQLKNESSEFLSANQINEGVKYISGGIGIANRWEQDILKSTELKLKLKGRNSKKKPQMLSQAKKYFNTQGNNMYSLDNQRANESKITTKYVPIQNYWSKKREDSDLWLDTKIPSSQTSNRTNLRKLPDKASYQLRQSTAKVLDPKVTPKGWLTTQGSRQNIPGVDFRRFYKEGTENVNLNPQTLRTKGRNSSSTSEITSTKDEQKVLSVVKVGKTNNKNKKLTNRMVLYLVDKDKDSSKGISIVFDL